MVLKTAADQIYNTWQNACKLDESDFFVGKVIDDHFILNTYKIELFPVYMLLMGYALENVIKGIIICQLWLEDPDSIKTTNFNEVNFVLKDGKSKRNIKTHRILADLLNAKVVNFVPSDREKKIFKEIENCVLWGGRYPVPKEVTPNKPFFPMTGLIIMDYEKSKSIEALYDKLIKELRRLIDIQLQNPPNLPESNRL